MFDFVFGLFSMGEIVIVIVIALIIGFAARDWFPKVKIRRIGFMQPRLLKKIQPNWSNRCRSCGAVAESQGKCPSCGLTAQEALDKIVFNYLTANDGLISRVNAASELRVSPSDLNGSLARLSVGHKIIPIPDASRRPYTT